VIQTKLTKQRAETGTMFQWTVHTGKTSHSQRWWSTARDRDDGCLTWRALQKPAQNHIRRCPL